MQHNKIGKVTESTIARTLCPKKLNIADLVNEESFICANIS